ncbi:MAG: VPLPA-CTERM sorting domain-containing protein [Gammaproteobacteria bacterium]|nr:VPLPA-CTERM sorting domain-containing protein [Gammaproteobacteria bacterium]
MDTLRLSVQAVPVPAAVWMLLSALGALGYARRRQRLH